MRWRVRLQVRYRRRVDLALAALALAVILTSLIGTLVWSPGQAVASPTQAEHTDPLQYYLTTDLYHGDQVLSACALGFHMASLWELLDTSNLRYNTTRGFTRTDSGYGPPATGGWIRTGYASDSTGSPGTSNCHAWTSGSESDVGSYVFLPGIWEADNEDLMGWAVATAICSTQIRVWCIGDESIIYLPLVMRTYTG
jgi:hypothetical protein